MASEDTRCFVQELPLETLLEIFKLIDPHTLVFSCRHVCRYWREAIEICGTLWKAKICEAQGRDSPLTNAFLDHPWYVCYAVASNVFHKNLFTGFEVLPANPPFWRDADSPGSIWSTLPFNDCTVGFPQLPPEVGNENSSPSFLTTVGVCRINHSVDLYKKGLTRKLLSLQPPIEISEWFAARFDHYAFSHFEVKLFNSDWQCDEEHGYYIHQQEIGWREWQHVTHTFTNYDPDTRYVVLHHGIATFLPQQFFAPTNHLHFRGIASKIVATKVIAGLPEAAGSSASSTSDS